MPGMELSLRHACILAGSMAAGFLGGDALRGNPHADATADAVPVRVPQGNGGTDDTPPPANPRGLDPLPDLRSDDTLDDLLALSQDDLYERLGLWLVDASSEDFRACWSRLENHPLGTMRILDLLFLRWTATDPLNAIRAAANSSHSHIPWWAWARNQPHEAFRHALETHPEHAETVLRGIGQAHPELALSLLAQHPELDSHTTMGGILTGLTTHDPEAAAKLVWKRGDKYNSAPLEAWLRKDPHAAFEWYLSNRSAHPPSHDQTVIESLARQNPEVLAELLQTTPPGAIRRQMEAAQFDQLIATDPEKALAQAMANPSKAVAKEQLIKIALAADPNTANSILDSLLRENPDFVVSFTNIHLPPDGRAASVQRRVSSDSSQLLTELTRRDPGTTMAIALAASGDEPNWTQTTSVVGRTWAAIEPQAYADWSYAQPDPRIREQAIMTLVTHHTRTDDYAEALSHVSQLQEPLQVQQTNLIVSRWNHIDPPAAREWAEAAGMPDDLESIFNQP